jgi:hypothetical protein
MIKGENDELKMSFPLESMKKIEASFHKQASTNLCGTWIKAST